MTETALSVGDPDAMRALASALISRADALAATTGRISGDVRSAVFEGPAATRVRGIVEDSRSQAMGAVDLLRQTASSLSTDAIEVERQNDALRAAAVAKAEADLAAETDGSSADSPSDPASPTATPGTGSVAGAAPTEVPA